VSSATTGVARGFATPIRYGDAMPNATTSLVRRPSAGSGGNHANAIAPSIGVSTCAGWCGLTRYIT
jgi:hypothetical protein